MKAPKDNTVFRGTDAVFDRLITESKHVLFLYTSHVSRYAIQASFFSMCNGDEKLLYITEENPDFIRNIFEAFDHELLVIHPESLKSLKITDKLRIIADGVVPHETLEEFLKGNEISTVLCMYELAKLEPESLSRLAAGHDRLILNTSDITVLSSSFFDKFNAADKRVERLVKEYLDIVILSLVASKPMCGTDILDIVHRNFNVLLSPGTIYPLLHRLKKDGLIECEYSIKKKVYKPARGSEANIQRILEEHSSASEFLNDFLKSRSLGANTA